MKFSTHGNGNGLNDLYIGFERTEKGVIEFQKIAKFLREEGTPYQCFSPQKGSEFEGLDCIEIAFGEHYQTILDGSPF